MSSLLKEVNARKIKKERWVIFTKNGGKNWEGARGRGV